MLDPGLAGICGGKPREVGADELARTGIRRGLRARGGVGARALTGGPDQPVARWCSASIRAGGLVVAGVHFPALPADRWRESSARRPRATPRRPAVGHHGADFTGGGTLAAEVDSLRDRIRRRNRPRTGPGRRRTGRSRDTWAYRAWGTRHVYAIGIPNRTDRHSQYDFWRPIQSRTRKSFTGGRS